MRRKKKNTEKQKELNKKGQERIRRYNELKEKPQKKKKKVVDVIDDGMTAQIYWEKDVIGGDEEWHERIYYYTKKKDKVVDKNKVYGPGEKK